MERDEDNRSLGERMRRPPALRLGMSSGMDAIASADLAMRVKALEADVAELMKRITGLTALAVRAQRDIEALQQGRAQR